MLMRPVHHRLGEAKTWTKPNPALTKRGGGFQVGFKIFLNITPTITNWTNDSKQFSLVFEENPLADFVELPDDERAQDELWYSNIFCGVLRGALEMIQMQVEAHFISDVLRGNDTTEMRISLIRYIDDELPPEDD